MAQDVFKPKGQTKASKPDAGGGAIRSEPVLAIVKDNIDPTRSGRLQVYISDFGSNDPDDAQSWVTVAYMSPFYGLTHSTAPSDGYGSYLQNPSSYGMWYSQPDIGTTVICIFINGDPNYGYWIGCVPQAEALTMVPAIGGSDNVVMNSGEAASYGGATVLPVTNMNTNNSSKADGPDFLSEARPVDTYVASILNQQGLIRDPIRGPITSSSQRESPSRVGWGVSTPGRPIYEGGYTDNNIAENITKENKDKLKLVNRRAGHSIVLDDGDISGKDQLIRLRTSLGHQILMSDDGQCLFIIHSNGQSWVELGKEGTIDMYATNSVNVRTQGDLNLHADNNVNIHAKKNFNLSAENITMTSEKDLKSKAGANFNQYTVGKYTVKVDGGMSMAAGGEASYASTSTTYINGSVINLNTGSTSLVPKVVEPIPVVAHTDTLFDATKGFAAAPGKLISITSRAPAHSPWANWGQGVDVKTSLNASDELPSMPSPAVAATNSSVNPTPDNPVTVATAASVQNVGSVSTSLDKNTTAAMVSAVAKDAALGPAAAAVAAGAGVVSTEQGNVAVLGQLGMTPQQLESAGIIKPGSSRLVNGLVNAGKSVEQALTPNLFTGKDGVTSVSSFTNNIAAQVSSQVTNFQQAQTALTNTGLITGKESPTQIAGLVMSTAQNGVQQTTNFVKNAVGSVTGAVNNLLGNANNPIAKSLSSGNFAASLTNSLTSGLSSITGSLSGTGKTLSGLIESAKGAAGSAFAAITKAFKPFEPNVPQNLKVIVAENTAETNEPTNATSGAFPSIGSILNNVKNFASKTVSSISAGLSGIPGGQSTISSVVDNKTGTSLSVPGISTVSELAKNSFSSATNSISGSLDSLGKTTGSLLGGTSTGVPTNLQDLATKGLDQLKEGSQSLTSLAATGLPKDAAASLSAAINSLGSGGAIPIKLPTVAIGTVDRNEIESQFSSLFGNSKIPAPDFNGISFKPLSSEKLAEYNQLTSEKEKVRDQFFEQKKAAADARLEYNNATNELPQGDPKIEQLRVAYEEAAKLRDELLQKEVEINKKISDLSKSSNTISA